MTFKIRPAEHGGDGELKVGRIQAPTDRRQSGRPGYKSADATAGHDAGHGKLANRKASLCLEPLLAEVMSDPIVRLVMYRDGVTDAAVWRVIKPVQALLAERSRQATRDGTAAPHKHPVKI